MVVVAAGLTRSALASYDAMTVALAIFVVENFCCRGRGLATSNELLCEEEERDASENTHHYTISQHVTLRSSM
jgi:hypothetical protein